MNFFESQDHARKSTRWLVLMFLLALLTLIALSDALVLLCFMLSSGGSHQQETGFTDVPLSIHASVILGVSAVVLFASLYKTLQLSGGGAKVAEQLGARLIPASTRDADERKALNVVEEMAIASGTPVPQVYLLDDNAINAFAAGFTPHDAVIAVTRGTIELLTREELQGVVAHEFSHILNGDMRLNLRLIGILFGILFLALIGQKIARHSGRSRDGGRVALFGVALMIIGYGGLFFGSMIKAAISRQREFLADASAVQFTRNPDSIGGALKKIGGWPIGSVLGVERAAEFGHLYIAEGIGSFAAGFFKTHPPLAERIRRIDPSWDGEYPKVARPAKAAELSQPPSTAAAPCRVVDHITTAVVANAIANAGAPTLDHVRYAGKLIAGVPQNLLAASRTPVSAYALLLGLFLGKAASARQQQLALLRQQADVALIAELETLLPDLSGLDVQYRLPLIEIAMPALKSLSAEQAQRLKQHVMLLIKADTRIDLWEWALYRVIKLSLDKPEIGRARYGDIRQLAEECRLVLAALVYTGGVDSQIGEAAFFAAASQLGLKTDLPSRQALNGSALSLALKKICELKPLAKPQFLKALHFAAQHDGTVTAEEVELIRAVAASIDCPMPPILQ